MKQCNATPTFTFTYTGLTKEGLKDAYCNELLEFGLENGARFIVFSDLLRDYIKEKSPKASVTASVIKAVSIFQPSENGSPASVEKETEYYNKLLKEYDMVVVRPEYSQTTLLKHPKYIDDISRIEVLINKTCVPNCPRVFNHYKFNDIHRNGYVAKFGSFICYKSSLNDKAHAMKRHSIHTQDQVSKLVKSGVRHLKLQGRGDAMHQYPYRLCSLFSQMFNTDGDAYMILDIMNSNLDKEIEHFNKL